MGDSPLMNGPLSLVLDVRCAIPTSWSKKKQAAALAGEVWPTGRPDLDNIVKLYADAFNGNKSQLHLDIVCIQTAAFGGGEIWFDGKLIRKDGLFTVDALKGLNP